MYDNAIACCKKIRRYAADDEHASLLLGRYYAAKGLRADAARELDAYADRMERGGRKKEALEALTELVQLAPDKPHQREKLGRLHAERGQRDAALEEYRAARREYQARGDEEGVARVAERIAEHERDRPGPQPASKTSDSRPPAKPVPAVPLMDRAAPEAPPVEGPAPDERPPIPLELEIERTSYAQEAPATPASVEPAETAPASASRGGSDETAARAEPKSAEGEPERVAASLVETAAALGAERRWEEAVAAYRELAGLGMAQDEHLSAWAEAARQAGMASLVLEALSFQARWHLEAGRRSSARRAAEEMLLVDPRNEVATEILSQVGSTLPRD